MTILDKIVEYKRTEELPRRKQEVSPAAVREKALQSPPPLDFATLLQKKNEVSLIAELKKASPSRGLLRPDFDPAAIAQSYIQHGAAAISVLTDEHFFQGKLDDLECVARFRKSSGGTFGLLRKDFVVDPYQVYEARASGADAILLIVAVLTDPEITTLLSLTHDLGMEALVEVHNRSELERALAFEPYLLGVNNRNLHDFSVDLETCLQLRSAVPAGTCFVAESGIHTRSDVERLGMAGVDAVLVGEALVTSPDPGKQASLLVGVRREGASVR